MNIYNIQVTELHEVKKTYSIEADSKREANKRARNNDWDYASPDEPTGNIVKVIIDRK